MREPDAEWIESHEPKCIQKNATHKVPGSARAPIENRAPRQRPMLEDKEQEKKWDNQAQDGCKYAATGNDDQKPQHRRNVYDDAAECEDRYGCPRSTETNQRCPKNQQHNGVLPEHHALVIFC